MVESTQKSLPKQKPFLRYYRLFFGLLGASAVITEVIVLVGRSVFVPANFFSYFTIESNVFAIILLLYLGVTGKARTNSRTLVIVRGAVTLYMLMTCIIFILLLSNLEGVMLTAIPWDNVVLHYIMPIAVLADWLLDRPTLRLVYQSTLGWLIFPVLYVVYSLIRGVFTGWYPYPFLNPTLGGYTTVVATAACLSVGIVFAAWLLWLPLHKNIA